jgi:hypothetical protein
MNMKMNSIHLSVGIITVIIFLFTGIYMRLNFPEIYNSNEAIRYIFRANHVYILLSGLINISTGTYLVLYSNNRVRNLQIIGSVLLLFAPILLIAAFFYEPPKARPDRYITGLGIVFILIGIICHLIANFINKHFSKEDK